MPTSNTTQPIAVCLALTHAISRAGTLDDIYEAALGALAQGLGVSRASILLFDADRVMRFKASRGLSETYRKAVEGHTPWTPETLDPQPIIVADVTRERSLQAFLQTIVDEGIAAMAFIPLVSIGQVIGKFMIYSNTPRELTADELQLAGVIAAQVAFAVTRVRAEDAARRAEAQSRRSQERLRFALEASSMGTWEWDLLSQSVQWSANLEQLHGLPPGTFDGTFDSYLREIHPDDRDRVLAAQRRATADGSPYDVEYRIVAPDGSVRWVEGKGRVELENGTPVRMTGVCIVVTRRKEAELARLAAAEEANRSKDEFLGTLSHELRTPLNAIVGWVQMLQQGDMVSPGRVAHAIEVIGRNARLQTQLIEDILDVTRIVTGQLDIERRPLLIPQLLEAVLTGLLPAADAKRISLSRDVPNHLPPVEGDAKRLHQVLSNILSNAIKFTPEGGRIRISCRVDRNVIVIDVQDSGAGIAPDFLPFVFDRFRQGDRRSARQHGGLGLGLAIARHLVEQHGGEIHAHSDGPGSGSTLSVVLPVAAGPRAHIARRELRSIAQMRLDNLTALVVDDDPDSRELLAAWLERCGAEVFACESTASAVAALGSAGVNLLVADLGMPGVDGYGLIERVRQLGNGDSRVPAVAVSAFARPEDRDKALTAGYDGYCPKPLDIPDFLRTVDAVLRRTGASVPDRAR
jgi:PAS domain S-box-containing protein